MAVVLAVAGFPTAALPVGPTLGVAMGIAPAKAPVVVIPVAASAVGVQGVPPTSTASAWPVVA